MNDERPSLARLRQLDQQTTWLNDNTEEVATALPVLLEIAVAALLVHGPCDHPQGRCGNGSHFLGCARHEGDQRMRVAVTKVRP